MSHAKAAKRRRLLRSVIAPYLNPDAPPRSKKGHGPVWVSSSRGVTREIPIPELTDSHLMNAITFLEQHADALRLRAIATGYSVLGMLRGDMSSFYTDHEIQRLEEMHAADFLDLET